MVTTPYLRHSRSSRWLLATLAALLLAGCEIPGIYPDPKAMAKEADAKATGGGCRHAMRALEDCYAMNPKAPRASVFAGWKEMDSYMRENKIDGVVPSPPVKSAEVIEETSVASKGDKAAEHK